MKIFDITIPLSERTPVWEGERGVRLTRTSSLSRGDDFNVSRIELGVHTGTHIDTPNHLIDGARTVDKIPLDYFMGSVQVLAIPDHIDVISPDILKESGFIPDHKRVLLKTRNSNFWKDDPFSFRKDFVAINSESSKFLVEKNIQLIGIDYFSISPLTDLKTPHEILLDGGVIILENINLLDVEPGEYHLCCLPLKLIGTDGAPVRAILTRI